VLAGLWIAIGYTFAALICCFLLLRLRLGWDARSRVFGLIIFLGRCNWGLLASWILAKAKGRCKV